MARSSRSYPQFNFRMPPIMKDDLKKMADKNGRSATAELLIILERALNATNNQGSNVTDSAN